MWHLLTHTSGLTYGFMQLHPVDALYRAAGFEFGNPDGVDLKGACDALAALPLRFQPGTAWGYGVSTDVLGRVIEVIAGMPLDEFLEQEVLGPLGMTDTQWWVEGKDVDRLAALYALYEDNLLRYDALGDHALSKPAVLNGGGGLISTAADYWQFTQMVLGNGALGSHPDPGPPHRGPDGQQPPARRCATWPAVNIGGFAETVFDGVGFGLGFAVVMDPGRGSRRSRWALYWGGLASTAFWVDPSTGVTAAFYTQLVPSSTYPIRSQLRQLVYSALLD